ncbi:sulfurase [Iamia sp. SCSIO 61187]|nr:sulfurase [Iamia sp. SCSIO 61187]
MVVDQLWRYPVKSMGGEQLAEAHVGPLGIDGDRTWGICDTSTGRVLTGRREPALLLAAARHLGPGQVEITLPDGSTPSSDADLSDWLGRPVALVASTDARVTFEVPDPDERDWAAYDAADGAWHDSPRARVSLVSHATVGGWDPRRFRSNVLLRGSGEEDHVGGTIGLGSTTLSVTKPLSRCVMVNRPLPGVEADRSILRTIIGDCGGTLAVGATIDQPGVVAVGDEVLSRAAGAPAGG